MFEEIARLIPAEFYHLEFSSPYSLQSDGIVAGSMLLTYFLLIPLRRLLGKKEKVADRTVGPADSLLEISSERKEVTSLQDKGGRVFDGLSKSRTFFASKVFRLWSSKGSNVGEFWAELEESLIAADMGVHTSGKLIAKLREQTSSGEFPSRAQAAEILKSEIISMLGADLSPLESEIKGFTPYVIMVVGVNGSGKTTTIGKLAKQLTGSGLRVMLAACDTFRAAAREQLEEWANRSGAMLECGVDSEEPATVVFRALEKVKAGGVDVLIVDTAGRLHTRVNLMHELESVLRLVSRDLPGAPHQTLLVLDGTSGQNALHQAREFKNKAGVTGIVITKLDGTPKGGIVVGIRDELEIPIRYIGVGERVDDLQPFRAAEFASALLEGFADDAPSPQLTANGPS